MNSWVPELIPLSYPYIFSKKSCKQQIQGEKIYEFILLSLQFRKRIFHCLKNFVRVTNQNTNYLPHTDNDPTTIFHLSLWFVNDSQVYCAVWKAKIPLAQLFQLQGTQKLVNVLFFFSHTNSEKILKIQPCQPPYYLIDIFQLLELYELLNFQGFLGITSI